MTSSQIQYNRRAQFILFILFIFKTRDMSKSIKAGTTRQETALTVALGIHINTSIKHYSSKAKHTAYEKH